MDRWRFGRFDPDMFGIYDTMQRLDGRFAENPEGLFSEAELRAQVLGEGGCDRVAGVPVQVDLAQLAAGASQ